MATLAEHLRLATMEDLLEELSSRFDTCVFLAASARGKESHVAMQWDGDPHAALGLAVHLQHSLTQHLARHEADDEEP